MHVECVTMCIHVLYLHVLLKTITVKIVKVVLTSVPVQTAVHVKCVPYICSYLGPTPGFFAHL